MKEQRYFIFYTFATLYNGLAIVITANKWEYIDKK